MRYVKLQITTKRVVDEIVEDEHTIRSILLALKSNELTCVVGLSDGPKMTGVRIDKVDDDDFSFRVINRRSTLSKKSKFSKIDYLEVSTDADLLVRNKPNVSRWTLLDPSDSDLSDEES